MDFLFFMFALGAVAHCVGGALSSLLGASSGISGAHYHVKRAEEEQRRAYARYREQQLAQEHYKARQEGDEL
jgi:hypothetical protein